MITSRTSLTGRGSPSTSNWLGSAGAGTLRSIVRLGCPLRPERTTTARRPRILRRGRGRRTTPDRGWHASSRKTRMMSRTSAIMPMTAASSPKTTMRAIPTRRSDVLARTLATTSSMRSATSAAQSAWGRAGADGGVGAGRGGGAVADAGMRRGTRRGAGRRLGDGGRLVGLGPRRGSGRGRRRRGCRRCRTSARHGAEEVGPPATAVVVGLNPLSPSVPSSSNALSPSVPPSSVRRRRPYRHRRPCRRRPVPPTGRRVAPLPTVSSLLPVMTTATISTVVGSPSDASSAGGSATGAAARASVGVRLRSSATGGSLPLTGCASLFPSSPAWPWPTWAPSCSASTPSTASR